MSEFEANITAIERIKEYFEITPEVYWIKIFLIKIDKLKIKL